MPELVGAIVVATGFLVLVVRDVLVVHGRVVRRLEESGVAEGVDGT